MGKIAVFRLQSKIFLLGKTPLKKLFWLKKKKLLLDLIVNLVYIIMQINQLKESKVSRTAYTHS